MENRTGRNDLFALLNTYCDQHSTPPSDILYQLERETYLKTLAPQMMSGPLQGQFLRFLSLWMQPKRILEVGTFTGYASLCLADGLPDNGELHTIEANVELEYLIRKYFNQSPKKDQLHLHIGNAITIIPSIPGMFDLIFLDAGKLDYANYFDLVIDRINPGGCLLADNVLWSGKVVKTASDNDTESMRAFNRKISEDPRVEQVILPIRDGLLMARKI